MIIIDNLTIILSAIVVILAVVTPWINVLARRPGIRTSGRDDETDAHPKISIVITPHENARELGENLPLFLSQDYPYGFQVIVVTWKGDSESEDVLKRFSGDPHLYTTYIPDSSRYMSRKKLAVTVGVKAATNEWILMTEITSRPDSGQWLATMARNCYDGTSLVVGYTRYDGATAGFRKFQRLATDFYLMRETCNDHTYRCDSTCLMFRKSEFIAQDGFRGNLKYLRGEYDFMANKYARPMGVALENSREGWMTEQEPSDKEWRNRHLFYMETRKHLRGSRRHRLLPLADQLALHLNYLAIAGAGVGGALSGRWVLVAASVLALVITIAARTAIASRAFSQWDAGIPAWKAVFYETSLPWRAMAWRLRFARADENDFISHKI